jgi:hypothetical protein
VRRADEAEALHGTRHGEPFLLYYERLSDEERVLHAAASTPAPESDEDEDEGRSGGCAPGREGGWGEKQVKEEEGVMVVVQEDGCKVWDGGSRRGTRVSRRARRVKGSAGRRR